MDIVFIFFFSQNESLPVFKNINIKSMSLISFNSFIYRCFQLYKIILYPLRISMIYNDISRIIQVNDNRKTVLQCIKYNLPAYKKIDK